MSASSFISPQHEAARNWAKNGFPVFPWRLVEGQKRPHVKDWENAATVNADIIDGWWSKWPSAGIGCPPARLGCFVLDIDDKKDKNGSSTLAAMEADSGKLPPTMETLTGSGGRHLWFKGEARTSASKLGTGLDIRGKGGWAALPDGVNYISLQDAEPAEPPEWLLLRIQSIAKENEERKVEHSIDLDQPVNLKIAERRVRDLVARGDVAIEGSGGNDRTYQLAQELQDLGLSQEASLTLMDEVWNPYCQPPWSRDELFQIVDNATQYRQNNSGVKGLDSSGSVFSSIVVPEGGESDQHKDNVKSSRFTPLSEQEQDELVEPPWLIPGWLAHGSTAILYGEPGSYKSFVALDAALSIAAGVSAWGINDPEVESFPVVYVAGEGAIGIAKKRRPAWRKEHCINRALPFWIVPETPLVREPSSFVEFMTEIEKRCEGQLPRLIVLDTLSRAMSGLNENDAQDASKAIELADGLSRRYNCTVLIVHHIPKSGEGPRGSGVFQGGPETLLYVSSDKASKTALLCCTKQKDAEEPKPIAFKLKSVDGSAVISRLKKQINYSFTSAASQLKMDISRVLVEQGAHATGSALTTAALADSLAQYWEEEGEPSELRKRISQQLRRFGKTKEGSGYTIPHTNPPLWAVPKPEETPEF